MSREYPESISREGAGDGWRSVLERELNREQLKFVTSDAPVIMGLAGPGSGKTRALVYRAAHLIKGGVSPGRIMLLTFTNKASEEMKNRLEALLGYRPHSMWAGTFHSIGARIIRKHASLLERTPGFSILDEEDRSSLWKHLIRGYKEDLTEEEVNLFIKRKLPERVASRTANSGRSLEEIVEEYYPWMEEYAAFIKELLLKYEEKKMEMNALDFDDLLVKWLELFETYPDLREGYLKEIDHVLVDEFQDTNVIQGRLVDLFAPGSSVCVVGDDAQSIYGFRFAELSNMVDFPVRHPSCRVYKLEENYRSYPEIVELANRIISRNSKQLPKKLFSNKGSGVEPVVKRLDNAAREARFVTDRVEQLLMEGVSPGEIAVLYRSSYLSSEVEFELLKRKMVYRTYGGKRFVQKAHVKDVLSWLKVAHNPRDTVSWRRLLSMQKGLGPASVEEVIRAIGSSNNPIKEILAGSVAPVRGKEGWNTVVSTLRGLLEDTAITQMIYTVLKQGYYRELQKRYPDSWEERSRDLERLAGYGKRCRELEEFLEALSIEESLFREEPTRGDDLRHITLSTIHSSKGKEWEAVFILGLNQGVFPPARVDDFEEERRLFYVAVTRAKRYLYLLSYVNEVRWGRSVIAPPSVFLSELSFPDYGDDRELFFEEKLQENGVDSSDYL